MSLFNKSVTLYISLIYGSQLLYAQLPPHISWQKSFGGDSTDKTFFAQETTDGGYLAIGSAKSNNGTITGNHGGFDDLVLKLDASGNTEWLKLLGGSLDDESLSGQQTSDGGFIVGGYSISSDFDVTSHYGDSLTTDCWVVKLSSLGNLEWQKNYGGKGDAKD